MLRLLILAAGAFWLRKPENRELAERKIREAWDRVVNGDEKRPHDNDSNTDNESHPTYDPPHENKHEL